ncbi:unnamed protein product [Auanema sp. JU1783]|nr:unnamed protein product [Auanema sp. JU1783]
MVTVKQRNAQAKFFEFPRSIAGAGWSARGDRKPSEKRTAFNRPTARQIYDALPFVRRYFLYWMKHSFDKEKLFINTFQPLKHKPFYGVPCGGIGCGSLGRDFRGGFCKFSLRPGLIEHAVDVIPANQFILSVRAHGKCIYQKVLCGADVALRGNQLSAWDFSFPKHDIYYRGLYPRSWTSFAVPELMIEVVFLQISPVFPNDYEDTSLPSTCFIVDVINNSNQDYEVSLTFTFRNGTGFKKWDKESACSSSSFEMDNISGVILNQTISQMPCKYGIATKKMGTGTTTICDSFNPSGNGSHLWKTLLERGELPENDVSKKWNARELGVAICNKTVVSSGSSTKMEFSLTWDMPIVRFGNEQREYKRRYTRFFDSENAAAELCKRSLERWELWEEKINNWQNPVLQHELLPDWYKSALFNELYFMTDGGSLWFEFDDNWSSSETQLSDYTKERMRSFGRFGYLESWEYRMINTYDVHFYASFALAQLWPELELVMQSEFTDQIDHQNNKVTRFHMEGDRASLKTGGRVPHDLGNPAHDPWLYTNAYVMHDTGKWKDLNLKYVLMSWRDLALLTNFDKKFLNHTWPAVKNLILDALRNWDQNGDGMIENFGKADQTYDAWQMEGVSAYCGSLWLAALRVSIEMAKMVEDSQAALQFTQVLENAQEVFKRKLWTGDYFRFCEKSRSRETIMADQLCGIWFLDSVSPELAREILPSNMIISSLNKIYSFNVCRFGGGNMGAVNGMRPNGEVDRFYIQADEMWTGVTYALSAFLLQHGEVNKAFHTASGCYDVCFEKSGLQYQTPEAVYETKYYRAIGYMRPLCIWAMQYALEQHLKFFSSTDNQQN